MDYARPLEQLSANDVALTGGKEADLGGALSHGSIVARQYGIPSVMGSCNAPKRIRDEQVISMDGTGAMVYLAK